MEKDFYRDDRSGKLSQEETTQTYLCLIFALSVFQVAWRVLSFLYPDLPLTVCSRLAEFTPVVISIYLYFTSKLIQRGWGFRIRKEDIRPTILHSLLIMVIMFAFYSALRLILQSHDPELVEKVFFHWDFMGFYLPVCVIQESISKAVLLHSFERTLPDRKWPMAVGAMVGTFAMFHTYHSFAYLCGAICIGLVTGILYHRDRHIYRCIVFHFCLGFLPHCFGLI